MLADAAAAGFQLQLNSGYRSFEQQQMLYDRFVQDYGAEVAAQRVALRARASTRPASLPTSASSGCPTTSCSATPTPASGWPSNAHEYGFIIRYPPDKAHITGYDNEPWHLRYVGARARHRAARERSDDGGALRAGAHCHGRRLDQTEFGDGVALVDEFG